MGREARRVRLGLEEPQDETFWGYLLDPIPCRSCNETGKNANGDWCCICEGEGNVHPKVSLPAYPVDALPSWFRVPELVKDFGWQMWETTSEGSPMSPIFKTPEELAAWLAETGASAFARMTATREEWLGMILHHGSASSAVLHVGSDGRGQMESGVAALSKEPTRDTET
jgi:hypothetical protein